MKKIKKIAIIAIIATIILGNKSIIKAETIIQKKYIHITKYIRHKHYRNI